MKGNSIQSWILDSTPRITNSRFRIPWSLSVKLRFWIPIVSGIPDSLSCIPYSKDQDFGFHKQKFPRIPEFGFPYVARKLAALLGRTSLPFVNLNEPEKLKGKLRNDPCFFLSRFLGSVEIKSPFLVRLSNITFF